MVAKVDRCLGDRWRGPDVVVNDIVARMCANDGQRGTGPLAAETQAGHQPSQQDHPSPGRPRGASGLTRTGDSDGHRTIFTPHVLSQSAAAGYIAESAISRYRCSILFTMVSMPYRS
jgi:hypothetical protein